MIDENVNQEILTNEEIGELSNYLAQQDQESLDLGNNSIPKDTLANPSQMPANPRDNSGVSKVKQATTGAIYTPLLLSDLSLEENAVEWIWEGYLAKGHLTLLAALWKAGKTTLVASLLKCLQNEQELASKNTLKCNVLILSEESDSIWARRREEKGISLPVWILSRPIKQKLGYKEWVSLLEQMAQFCIEHEISLLIIDTLAGFWSVDNENDAGRVAEALLPLNYLLEHKIAVLLVHHFRKSGGDEGTASRGSGQLGAAVDILVEFSRLNSSDPNCTQRVIKGYSRFEETPKEIVIDYVDSEYETKGTRADVNKIEKLNIVLDVLEDYPEGATTSELYEKWNVEEYGNKPSKRTIQRHLSDLVTSNEVRIVETKRVNGGNASVYIKLFETNPRQARATTGNFNDLDQSQNLSQDTRFNHLSGVQEQPQNPNSDNALILAAEEIFGVDAKGATNEEE